MRIVEKRKSHTVREGTQSSDTATTVAALLKDVWSPERSSNFGKAARLGALASAEGYVFRHEMTRTDDDDACVRSTRPTPQASDLIIDTSAQIQLVCPARKKNFMTSVTKVQEPLPLETAVGDLSLDTVGDLICGGVVCRSRVFNPLLSVSLFGGATGEKDGIFYERCHEGHGVL